MEYKKDDIFRLNTNNPTFEDMFDEDTFIDIDLFSNKILDFISDNLDRIEVGLFDFYDVDSCFMGKMKTPNYEFPLYLPHTSYRKALKSATELFIQKEYYELAHKAKLLLDRIEELKIKQND